MEKKEIYNPALDPRSPMFDLKQYLPEHIGEPSLVKKTMKNVAAIAKFVVNTWKNMTKTF